MGRTGSFVLAWAVIALATSTASAQIYPRFPGFGEPIFLLTQKSVQEELKLSPDQVKKVQEYDRKRRQATRNLTPEERQDRKKGDELEKDRRKFLAELLQPEQDKRLQQILIQEQHISAFINPRVVKALNLTEEQKGKIKVMRTDSWKPEADLLPRGRRLTEEERTKFWALRESTRDKVVNDVLTADQKAKWKELIGEPYKGEIWLGQDRAR
jgi:hypothetical protein